MNKVLLIGRLTKDPELRYTQSGKAVAKFTLAVDNGYGEKKSTEFIDIVVWEKRAETCAKHIGKGSRVAIEGRLTIRSYESNDGSKRKATEVVANDVVIIDFKKDDSTQTTTGFNGEEITFDASDILFD